MDLENVSVVFRDSNGLRVPLEYVSWQEAYEDFVTMRDSGESLGKAEIQLVCLGDTCIYSAIGSQPITLDELIGFFA